MNIYVGNLAWKTRQKELKELFENFGEVNNAFIVRDKVTRRSRGFGFVEMAEEKDALQAIEKLNNTVFLDRTIVVNEALPRDDENDGGKQDADETSGGKADAEATSETDDKADAEATSETDDKADAASTSETDDKADAASTSKKNPESETVSMDEADPDIEADDPVAEDQDVTDEDPDKKD